MIRGLYTAATGMITKQMQQENLSNNIANINTAGYKKDKVVLKSFKEMVLENKDKTVGGKPVVNKLGVVEFGVAVDETKTIFSQGNIEPTERNLDFAISGDGFFSVLNEKGEKVYTRDGRFRINDEGYLTTSQGYKVLGLNDQKKETTIKITNKDFLMDVNQKIDTANGKMTFEINKFDKETDLVKDAFSCYKALKAPKQMEKPNVTQKAFENANVDSIEVITEMISVMRNYESNQKVMAAIDETLGKTVNEVGAVR